MMDKPKAINGKKLVAFGLHVSLLIFHLQAGIWNGE